MATDIVCYCPKDRDVLVIRVVRNGENWSWITAMNLYHAGATRVGSTERGNEKFIANLVYEVMGNGLIYRLFDDGLGRGAECLEFMVDPDSGRRLADVFLELPKLLRLAGINDEQGLAVFERYLRSHYLVENPADSSMPSNEIAIAIQEKRNEPSVVANSIWWNLGISVKKTGRWVIAGSITGALAGGLAVLLQMTAEVSWFGQLVLSENGQLVGKVVSWLLFLGVFGAICECLGSVAEDIMAIGGLLLFCFLIWLGMTVVKVIAPIVTGSFFGLLIGAVAAGIVGFLVQCVVGNTLGESFPKVNPSARP